MRAIYWVVGFSCYVTCFALGVVQLGATTPFPTLFFLIAAAIFGQWNWRGTPQPALLYAVGFAAVAWWLSP